MRLSNDELKSILDTILNSEGKVEFLAELRPLTEQRNDAPYDFNGVCGYDTAYIALDSILRYLVGEQNGEFTFANSNSYDGRIARGNWYNNNAAISLGANHVDWQDEYEHIFKTTFFCTHILLSSVIYFPDVTKRIFNLSYKTISVAIQFFGRYLGGTHYDPDIAPYLPWLVSVLGGVYQDSDLFSRGLESGTQAKEIAKQIEKIVAIVFISKSEWSLSLQDDVNCAGNLLRRFGLDVQGEFGNIIDTALLRQDKELLGRLKDDDPDYYETNFVDRTRQ